MLVTKPINRKDLYKSANRISKTIYCDINRQRRVRVQREFDESIFIRYTSFFTLLK